jgi:serine/threonine-protein kinase HipA
VKDVKYIKVLYGDQFVGRLALMPDGLVAFEYDAEWIAYGFSISPFSLPLAKKVFIPKFDPFNGLFGMFNDSLPDGWGRLLINRLLLEKKIDPQSVSSLARLSIVGSSGMGALSYAPENTLSRDVFHGDFDLLAVEIEKILNTEYSDNLDAIAAAGGSSGGARPKILTVIDGEPWIVKFFTSQEPKNTGTMEYEYSTVARECGLSFPETRLFPSKRCDGYFGVKRFDRMHNKKIHMISISGLLESSHRFPNLDYHLLMKLTLELTGSFEEVEKMYRLMCFNVFAHNRDDHSKNFSYIMDHESGQWKLSPAYDLTFSSSLNGEHATMINGNGKNPSNDDILAVAKEIGIGQAKAKKIMTEIKEATLTLRKFRI